MYEDYRPVPIDTSDIVLSDEMIELVKRLAYDQHELRAKEFLDAGWVFGDTRNCQKRTHPTLMPYKELTEEQKDQYFKTVSSIVKTIIALGYNISM